MALVGKTPVLTPGEAAARLTRAGARLIKRNALNGRALYQTGSGASARYVVYAAVKSGVVLEEHDSAGSCGC